MWVWTICNAAGAHQLGELGRRIEKAVARSYRLLHLADHALAAFASIREMLIRYSAKLPGSRVLDGSYQTNLAGVAVAKEKVERLGYVSEFLEELKRSGSLKKIIDDSGLRGVELANRE